MEKTEVNIYACNINSIETDGNLDESIFEKKRLNRIIKCKNEVEKKRLICTGIFLNKVLSSFDVSVEKIEYSDTGKPFIKGRNDLFFNISHSNDWIIIAVSGSEIGADIQAYRDINEALVKRITTNNEYELVKDLSPVLLWSIKESYSKLIGTGIGMDFKDISFEIFNDDISYYYNGKFSAFGKRIFISDGYETVIVSKNPVCINKIELLK